MLPVSLDLRPDSHVLVLGCHADDAEIGCGGTLLTLLARHPSTRVTWVVLSAGGERAAEARASAAALLGEARHELVVESFRDGFFPYVGAELKEFFESLKERVDPDVVFTHVGIDLHQDHRVVSELTWNTFRNHLVLEYEVPKFDGDLRSPNAFVPLTEEILDRKVELLLEHFPTQRGRQWFDADLFRGLARLRGAESASPTGYAEGFRCRKLLLEP